MDGWGDGSVNIELLYGSNEPPGPLGGLSWEGGWEWATPSVGGGPE